MKFGQAWLYDVCNGVAGTMSGSAIKNIMVKSLNHNISAEMHVLIAGVASTHLERAQIACSLDGGTSCKSTMTTLSTDDKSNIGGMPGTYILTVIVWINAVTLTISLVSNIQEGFAVP